MDYAGFETSWGADVSGKVSYEKQIIDDFKLFITIKVFGTGAGASPDGYYVEHMNKPNSHHIFSAPNMAGFLDVNQIKDEVNSNLQWMYDNGIYYVKVKFIYKIPIYYYRIIKR